MNNEKHIPESVIDELAKNLASGGNYTSTEWEESLKIVKDFWAVEARIYLQAIWPLVERRFALEFADSE